jgi:hypothetical protein
MQNNTQIEIQIKTQVNKSVNTQIAKIFRAQLLENVSSPSHHYHNPKAITKLAATNKEFYYFLTPLIGIIAIIEQSKTNNLCDLTSLKSNIAANLAGNTTDIFDFLMILKKLGLNKKENVAKLVQSNTLAKFSDLTHNPLLLNLIIRKDQIEENNFSLTKLNLATLFQDYPLGQDELIKSLAQLWPMVYDLTSDNPIKIIPQALEQNFHPITNAMKQKIIAAAEQSLQEKYQYQAEDLITHYIKALLVQNPLKGGTERKFYTAQLKYPQLAFSELSNSISLIAPYEGGDINDQAHKSYDLIAPDGNRKAIYHDKPNVISFIFNIKNQEVVRSAITANEHKYNQLEFLTATRLNSLLAQQLKLSQLPSLVNKAQEIVNRISPEKTRLIHMAQSNAQDTEQEINIEQLTSIASDALQAKLTKLAQKKLTENFKYLNYVPRHLTLTKEFNQAKYDQYRQAHDKEFNYLELTIQNKNLAAAVHQKLQTKGFQIKKLQKIIHKIETNNDVKFSFATTLSPYVTEAITEVAVTEILLYLLPTMADYQELQGQHYEQNQDIQD